MSTAIKKFVKKEERYVEIYKITSLTSGKCYVGQAVSHILNHKKYRRYGMNKRFNCHVSEAFSKKKNQCHYLNNAIRKYGADDFEVSLLDTCSIEESDDRESHFIIKLNTMFPTGYNLKHGTKTTRLSKEGRRRVSKGVHEYYKLQKIERFKDVIIDESVDIENYIKPLRRDGKQYGWYVYIERKKADFGGVHITLDESHLLAVEFIQKLKKRNSETPCCGKPLKS